MSSSFEDYYDGLKYIEHIDYRSTTGLCIFRHTLDTSTGRALAQQVFERLGETWIEAVEQMEYDCFSEIDSKQSMVIVRYLWSDVNEHWEYHKYLEIFTAKLLFYVHSEIIIVPFDDFDFYPSWLEYEQDSRNKLNKWYDLAGLFGSKELIFTNEVDMNLAGYHDRFGWVDTKVKTYRELKEWLGPPAISFKELKSRLLGYSLFKPWMLITHPLPPVPPGVTMWDFD